MKQLSLKTVTKGNPQGDSLLVIHGWAMNSTAWSAVKPDLEKHFLVTWVDLPGHGINADVKADSLSQIVDLMIPFVINNQTVNKQTHIMGWSLGGLVAQALADRKPECIKTLTLVASSPRFSQTKNWLHAMPNVVLKNFAKNLQRNAQTTIKRFIALQFMGVKDSKQIQRDLIKSILAAPASHNALATGLDILTTADFRESSHTIPQHWILAGRDRLVPKEVINDLKLLHPNAQITLLENAGHAPFMTHPNEFMQCFLHVIAYLKGTV